MNNGQSSNKTIAKNTLLLYARMFVTIILGLYTSRIILNALGVIDYGIYNVVGGVVAMLAFLNVGMAGASQRFLSFELGRGNTESVRTVFSNCVVAHYIIAILVVLAMETFGIWFVNNKLIIPDDRLYAANWVLQCSITTLAISIISVPYNACIIAHEKMGQFAYISILETFLKFSIAVVITYCGFDKLIIYAILIMITQLIIRIIYTVYCKKNFEECNFKFQIDKPLLKDLLTFASWGCFGNMGFTLKDQLSNVILNLFYGTTVNAARGIAGQVSSIINGFASNFTMAMNPQITKQYSVGNIQRSKELAVAGSRYSFYLLSVVSIPFIINVDYVLKLWLGIVPEYTGIFVSIILIASCVYSMSHTISTAILATGKIRLFQTLLSIILFLDIPIAYLLLKFGHPPYWALLPSVFTNGITLILRIILLHKYVPEYSVRDYIFNTIIRCSIIYILALGISLYVHGFFQESFGTVVLTSLISIIITISIIIIFGTNKKEKEFIQEKLHYLSKKR